VVHPRRVAAQALHGLEGPAAGLVADGGFSRYGELATTRVDVFALRAPGAFQQEKGMSYPRISKLSRIGLRSPCFEVLTQALL
jgi:hypothetical protein